MSSRAGLAALRLPSLTLAAGLSMMAVSLYFSAHGWVGMLRGGGWMIVVFAAVLELGKVGSLVYLLQHGRWRLLPVLAGVGVFFLVALSTVGIYGFLSRAYALGQTQHASHQIEVTALEEELSELRASRQALYAQVEAIPVEHSSNRARMLARVQPRIEQLDSVLGARQTDLRTARLAGAETEADVGQLAYAAAALGLSGDQLARIVIATMALLLDPLAVLLILASGAHRRREPAATGAPSDFAGWLTETSMLRHQLEHAQKRIEELKQSAVAPERGAGVGDAPGPYPRPRWSATPRPGAGMERGIRDACGSCHSLPRCREAGVCQNYLTVETRLGRARDPDP